jgi:hypothetical protein
MIKPWISSSTSRIEWVVSRRCVGDVTSIDMRLDWSGLGQNLAWSCSTCRYGQVSAHFVIQFEDVSGPEWNS